MVAFVAQQGLATNKIVVRVFDTNDALAQEVTIQPVSVGPDPLAVLDSPHGDMALIAWSELDGAVARVRMARLGCP